MKNYFLRSPFIFRNSSLVIEALFKEELMIAFCCLDHSLSLWVRTYSAHFSTNSIRFLLFFSAKFIQHIPLALNQAVI